ncbi:MAG: STAS/SEC14 domain-containing protein [Sphingopyxis sp.]|nr:STAS/SEC14 domain-containing protein [Sphingopyxis sp.]
MMEWLDSADDVIALKMANKIAGSDLETIMDRLDKAMAHHDKVHVFVETQSIDGIQISGLGSYVSRAIPLFGKLGRFGRVAVVADQAWLRTGTRIESALLPLINYRTYKPEQRGEAFAWVTSAGPARDA